MFEMKFLTTVLSILFFIFNNTNSIGQTIYNGYETIVLTGLYQEFRYEKELKKENNEYVTRYFMYDNRGRNYLIISSSYNKANKKVIVNLKSSGGGIFGTDDTYSIDYDDCDNGFIFGIKGIVSVLVGVDRMELVLFFKDNERNYVSISQVMDKNYTDRIHYELEKIPKNIFTLHDQNKLACEREVEKQKQFESEKKKKEDEEIAKQNKIKEEKRKKEEEIKRQELLKKKEEFLDLTSNSEYYFDNSNLPMPPNLIVDNLFLENLLSIIPTKNKSKKIIVQFYFDAGGKLTKIQNSDYNLSSLLPYVTLDKKAIAKEQDLEAQVKFKTETTIAFQQGNYRAMINAPSKKELPLIEKFEAFCSECDIEIWNNETLARRIREKIYPEKGDFFEVDFSIIKYSLNGKNNEIIKILSVRKVKLSKGHKMFLEPLAGIQDKM